MAEYYLTLKTIHVLTVVVTGVLFVLRGGVLVAGYEWARARWLRVVPHVNDTILLLSGIALSLVIHQYPIQQMWLTAKLATLVVYIVLGMVALHGRRSPAVRALVGVAALGCYGYMIATALAHDARPWQWAFG